MYMLLDIDTILKQIASNAIYSEIKYPTKYQCFTALRKEIK